MGCDFGRGHNVDLDRAIANFDQAIRRVVTLRHAEVVLIPQHGDPAQLRRHRPQKAKAFGGERRGVVSGYGADDRSAALRTPRWESRLDRSAWPTAMGYCIGRRT
jgi:hypothetical protein